MRANFLNSGVVSILGILLLALILVLLLNYFHLRVVIEPEGDQGKASVAQGRSLWNEYVKVPLAKLWNIIRELFWEPFLEAVNGFREGKPINFDSSAPTVPY